MATPHHWVGFDRQKSVCAQCHTTVEEHTSSCTQVKCWVLSPVNCNMITTPSKSTTGSHVLLGNSHHYKGERNKVMFPIPNMCMLKHFKARIHLGNSKVKWCAYLTVLMTVDISHTRLVHLLPAWTWRVDSITQSFSDDF